MRIVTAYVRQPSGSLDKETDYLDRFKLLAETGLPITAFVEAAVAHNVAARLRADTDCSIIPITFNELPLASVRLTRPCLPEIRNHEKDTLEYLIIQNSKSWFLQQAVAGKFLSGRMAWVDFGISHILQAINPTLRLRRTLSKMDRLAPGTVHIPGCWPPRGNLSLGRQLIDWRFCGGVVVTDQPTATRFHDECMKAISRSLPLFTWEVNVWAGVEFNNPGLIQWYRGDHNDSILDFLVPESEGGNGVRPIAG